MWINQSQPLSESLCCSSVCKVINPRMWPTGFSPPAWLSSCNMKNKLGFSLLCLSPTPCISLLFVLMGFCSWFSPQRMSFVSCWGFSVGLFVCSGAVNCYTVPSLYIALGAHSQNLPLRRCDACLYIFVLCLLSNTLLMTVMGCIKTDKVATKATGSCHA